MSKYPRALDWKVQGKTRTISPDLVKKMVASREDTKAYREAAKQNAEELRRVKRTQDRLARQEKRRADALAIQQSRRLAHAALMVSYAEHKENMKKKFTTALEVLETRCILALDEGDWQGARQLAGMRGEAEERAKKYLSPGEITRAIYDGKSRFTEAKTAKEAKNAATNPEAKAEVQAPQEQGTAGEVAT